MTYGKTRKHKKYGGGKEEYEKCQKNIENNIKLSLVVAESFMQAMGKMAKTKSVKNKIKKSIKKLKTKKNISKLRKRIEQKCVNMK